MLSLKKKPIVSGGSTLESKAEVVSVFLVPSIFPSRKKESKNIHWTPFP